MEDIDDPLPPPEDDETPEILSLDDEDDAILDRIWKPRVEQPDDLDDEPILDDVWEQIDREDKERSLLEKTLPKEELEALREKERKLADNA